MKPQSKRPAVVAITAIWIMAMSGTGWGEVRQWKVGEGGESWASQELASTALDFSQAGTIKSLGFDSQNNITQQLSWVSARPIGFLEERAQGPYLGQYHLERVAAGDRRWARYNLHRGSVQGIRGPTGWEKI